MDESIKALVQTGASMEELRAAALGAGMRSLRASGLQAALEGRTTLEEVLRETAA